MKVVLPNGSVRPYRGSVALIKRGSGGRTINTVLLEDYVQGGGAGRDAHLMGG